MKSLGRAISLVSLLIIISLLAVACAPAQPASAPPAAAPAEPAAPATEPEATEAAPAEPVEAVAPAEQVTLTMWDIYPEGQPFREVLDNAIARYNQSYPNVKVNVVSYSIADFKTKIVTVLAAGGKDFDIFQTWGGGQLATYAKRGQVLDLTDAMAQDNWQDRFSPAALSFVTADEKIWGVPVELATVLFFYNTEMFAANGVEVPANFGELIDACGTLKSNGIIPISLGINKAAWTGDFFYQYLVTRLGGLEPFQKAITRAEDGTFADPVFVQAGEMLQQMVDAGCFPDGFTGAEYVSIRQLLGQEVAAMTLMGSWLPGQMATEFPDFLPKMDYFRFPTVEGGAGVETDIVGGTNAAFAIAQGTQHPEEALALLRELSSEETAADVLNIAKRLPATKYELDPATVDPLTVRVADELNQATAVQLYYDQSSTPGLATAHLDQITALFSKTMTPEEAAQAWEEEAQKELE